MSAPYPNSAQHEAVSPQIAGASPQLGPVSPQITGITNTPPPTHDAHVPAHPDTTTERSHQETIESMNSGIEVMVQPPGYSNGAAPGPGVNEKSAYPGHDQPIAQPQQAYSQDPNARGFAQPPPPEGHYAEEQQQQKGVNPPAAPRNNYQMATPLGSLQQGPAPVDCPVCGVREMTRTEFVSGGTTHLSAALCCFCFCLGCVPYIASWFKDCEHKCGNCGALLAVWHRSGRTEVLVHART
ncbi:hypothetical protein LOCC1_G007261 [Lachnellula occidentalis]|uniref:LITAF domain-containing protein n=1 Tax=Lachnellula occidentalis TaxID=215460 RepID=A0A8H8U839_9HELO|nr:hypothetical protein LOCC1_G007261 [Lachnellula occidentalis]